MSILPVCLSAWVSGVKNALADRVFDTSFEPSWQKKLIHENKFRVAQTARPQSEKMRFLAI